MNKFLEKYNNIMSESMGAADYYLKNLRNSILFFIGKYDFEGSFEDFKQQIQSEFGSRGLELFSDEQLKNLYSKKITD